MDPFDGIPMVATLKSRLDDKKAVIGVVGLGYVGLPLAVEYAAQGLSVIGVDLDTRVTEALNKGQNHIDDVDDERLRSAVEGGLFRATDSFEALAEADVIFICVPSPVTEHKTPDVSYIRGAAEGVAKSLRAGQAVVLKSTTYPDTTEGLVQPVLETRAALHGLTLGKDYFLAFSPERIDPGNQTFTTANTPVVVGGVTKACTEVVAHALAIVTPIVHRVSSPRVAEMEKLLENIFRSVNIALVNELARLCDRMGGISIWEVVEAAATKPFGYMPFYPGPGLGGHCIPIDPYYLSWLARQYDFETNFITLSARTNEEMPFYVYEGILKAVASQPVVLDDAKVLLLGVAFKRNVDDTRHSPAERLVQILAEKHIGAIAYSDPHVPEYAVETRQGTIRMQSVDLTPEELARHDVVVVLTDHDAFDYELIAEHARYVVDTRNVASRAPFADERLALLGGGSF